jgi:hypothetical protein
MAFSMSFSFKQIYSCRIVSRSPQILGWGIQLTDGEKSKGLVTGFSLLATRLAIAIHPISLVGASGSSFTSAISEMNLCFKASPYRVTTSITIWKNQ